MADLDLRPLSLGEILDRTFSLYRNHFALFVGITAIPQLLVLAFNLLGGTMPGRTAKPIGGPMEAATLPPFPTATAIIVFIVGILIYLVVYLYAQGGTFFAVSEIYLGRTASIGASLSRMRGHVLKLLGVTILNGLVVGVATILLIFPGIYMACRLLTCVPAALFEDLGAGDSLTRSYELTRDEAGRAFVILLLYVVLSIIASMLVVFPFQVMAGLSVKDPGMTHLWISLMHVGNFLARVLVAPYITIATSIFYFDLRVRKEAFDLQLMLNASGQAVPGASGIAPSIS